jgi:hypothetical protein
MEQLRDLYKQATTDEDRALWRDQIILLQGELFDGEELARIRAEEEEERIRQEEEAAAAARRKAKEEEAKAAAEKKKQQNRSATLADEIADLEAQIAPVDKRIDEAQTTWDAENPYTEDTDYEVYIAKYDEFQQTLQADYDLLYYGDGTDESPGLALLLENLRAEQDVLTSRANAEEAAVADALRIEAEAKAAYEKEQARLAAEAAIAKAEEEARVKREEQARIAEEKRLAAEAAAAEEARIQEALNNLDKTDETYIAVRKEFVEKRVDKRIQDLEQSTAEAVASETEEFAVAREATFAALDEQKTRLDKQIEDAQVSLNELDGQLQGLWERQERVQSNLLEVQSEREFERVLENFYVAVQELSSAYSEIDSTWTRLSTLENTRNGVDDDTHIAELKQQADYEALFISRLQEEIAKEQAKLTGYAGQEDEDVLTAESEAVIAWYGERVAARAAHATWTMDVYLEAQLDRDGVLERQKKELTIQREQNELSQTWNAVHGERQVLDAVRQLASNLDPEENEKDLEKLNARIGQMTEAINQAEAAAMNQQGLLDKKRNALYRQIENEDFRKNIANQKTWKAGDVEHLAWVQTRMTEVSTEVTSTTDAMRRGELKVEYKLLEIDETDTKARIAQYTTDIAELETQFSVRQEEMKLQMQIEDLDAELRTYYQA